MKISSPLALLAACLLLMPAAAQEPKTSVREIVTLLGTVEGIVRGSRTLTVQVDNSFKQSLYVPPEFKIFDELKIGDRIVARIRESIVVSARPGLKPKILAEHDGRCREEGANRPAAHGRCHDRKHRPDNQLGHVQDGRQSARHPCRRRPETARRSRAGRRHRSDADARARDRTGATSGHRTAQSARIPLQGTSAYIRIRMNTATYAPRSTD